jgi:glycosyltransferase involved in cell wall biosynthesis
MSTDHPPETPRGDARRRRASLTIVHAVASLEPGGLEQFAVRLATLQLRHGHRAAILAIRGGPFAEPARRAGVEVRALNGTRRAARWARGLAYLARRRADVVHAHNPTALHYAAAAKFVSRAKVVLTDHGQCAGVVRVPRPWELARTDAIVSVSADVADRHQGLYGPGRSSTVIRNGVEFAPARRSRAAVRAELALPDGATGIVVARAEPVKGHDTLLRALGVLRQQGVAVNLLIVGDGSERPRLEALAGQLGLDPARVRFLGFRTDVPDLLAAADFFVLSSLQEGLPLAVLEAMAHSLPVIATPVGGVPEVLTDGAHGFLVPTRASDLLAAAIGRLAADPELRQALGQAGARRVEHEFLFEHMAGRYEHLYRALLGEAPTPPPAVDTEPARAGGACWPAAG